MTDQTRPSDRRVHANGVTLRYREQGSGVPVVFLHGSLADGRIWDGQRDAVASRYRFVALDQRYFGLEPWIDGGERFDQPTHADDLVAFIRALDAGPAHVVAWSYGGSVATLAATRHPDVFRSLVLHEPTIASLIVDTPEGRDVVTAFDAERARFRALARAGDLPTAMRRFWEYINRLPAGATDREPAHVQRILEDNQRTVPLTLNAPPSPLTREMIGGIRRPTLITVGATTRAIWLRSAAAWQRAGFDARFEAIVDGNHDAIVRTPHAFNALLMPFLDDH